MCFDPNLGQHFPHKRNAASVRGCGSRVQPGKRSQSRLKSERRAVDLGWSGGVISLSFDKVVVFVQIKRRVMRSGVSSAKPSLCVATGTRGAGTAIGWGEVVAAVRVQSLQLAEANVSQRLAMLINSADLQLFHWQRRMHTENLKADILVT